MKAPTRHMPFIDGLRGLAAFAVFLLHAYTTATDGDQLPWRGWFRDVGSLSSAPYLLPLTYGGCGVPMFFVISGFCIHLSHRRDPRAGWAEFWRRRFWRIYPPYALAVLVFFFVWPWGTFVGWSTPERQEQLWSHLLLAHNFSPRTIYGITGPLWSIAVEMQLYAIYPLLLMLVARVGWRHALIAAAALEVAGCYSDPLALRLLESRAPYLISQSPFRFWASWSLGAYLAQCHLGGQRSALSRVRFDAMLFIALVVPLFRPTEPLGFLACALATAVAMDRLVSGAWSPPAGPRGSVLWKHVSFLGMVSYSFYLLHQPMIGLTDRVLSLLVPGMTLSSTLKVFVMFVWYPVVLLLSFGCFKWIETPAANYGRRVGASGDVAASG